MRIKKIELEYRVPSCHLDLILFGYVGKGEMQSNLRLLRSVMNHAKKGEAYSKDIQGQEARGQRMLYV